MAEEKKLTVLQLLPALESGGVERGTLEVAEALVQRGHRALVISAGGRLVAPLTAMGAEHFAWSIGKKSLKTLLLVGKLRQFLLGLVPYLFPSAIYGTGWLRFEPAP